MSARIGLVLGGGGAAAHAYECGALRAIEDHTGWDARDAALVIGTSAGAQVAALIRAGMSSCDLFARVRGEALSPSGAEVAAKYVRPDHTVRVRHPRPFPVAPRALIATLHHPWRVRPLAIAAALTPAGDLSLEPQARAFRAIYGANWPDAAMWICAVDVDRVARVAFGAAAEPRPDVGTAVIASGAVPGLTPPVVWRGRRYTDGFVWSPLNLDLVARADLDLVIAIAPSAGPGRRDAGLRDTCMRVWSRSHVRRERRSVERSGIPVVLVEPTRADVGHFGSDPLDASVMSAVAARAHASVSARKEIWTPIHQMVARGNPANLGDEG